jgi:hypothetical protein
VGVYDRQVIRDFRFNVKSQCGAYESAADNNPVPEGIFLQSLEVSRHDLVSAGFLG